MHTITSKLRTQIIVGSLAAATILAGTVTAFAADGSATPDQNQPGATIAAPKFEAIPQASLKAKRYAVVASTGTLARGKNVAFADQVSGGAYEVFFDRDVTQCAYVATLGTTSTGTESPGAVTVAQRAGEPTAVWVDTSDMSGADAVHSFHLEVVC